MVFRSIEFNLVDRILIYATVRKLSSVEHYRNSLGLTRIILQSLKIRTIRLQGVPKSTSVLFDQP